MNEPDFVTNEFLLNTVDILFHHGIPKIIICEDGYLSFNNNSTPRSCIIFNPVIINNPRISASDKNKFYLQPISYDDYEYLWQYEQTS